MEFENEINKMNNKIEKYIEYRKEKLGIEEFIEINVNKFIEEFGGDIYNEEFISEHLFNKMNKFLEENNEKFKKYSSTKKKIVFFFELECFLNWFLPNYFELKPIINNSFSDIYNLVCLYINNKEIKNRIIEYLDSINTNGIIIDSGNYMLNFFMKNYYQLLYNNYELKSNTEKLKKYFDLFDDLVNDINSGKINIKIIDDNLIDNNEEENELNVNESNLTLYDYYVYAHDYLLGDICQLFYGYTLLKCLNFIENYNNIKFAKGVSYKKTEYLNIIFEKDDLKEEIENNYYLDSFLYYLIQINKSVKYLEDDCEVESYNYIKNIIMNEYNIFIEKSLEFELDIIVFSDKFILDYYHKMVRDIIRYGYKIRELYIILLNKQELLTDILKMTYMNLMFRDVDEGYFIRNERNGDIVTLLKFNKDTKKEELIDENFWINLIISDILNKNSKVKDICMKIIRKYNDEIYLDYKNKTENLNECNICLENTCKKTNLYCNQCRHNYHILCMNKWIKKSIERNCPICRKNINSTTIPNYQFYYDFYNKLLENI